MVAVFTKLIFYSRKPPADTLLHAALLTRGAQASGAGGAAAERHCAPHSSRVGGVSFSHVTL